MNFIDLFAGTGAFTLALESSDKFRCVFSNDMMKCSKNIYDLNHTNHTLTLQDLNTIDVSHIPAHDILCGGFPCQPFSNGGKKKAFDDDRGLLFDEIIRIAKVKKPSFMFLENVKHILKVNNGEVIRYIKQKINETGYELQLFQLSPHEYGIPQQRERIYFVCVRKDIYKNENFLI